MYTKEEREGILWEFHRSGLSAPAACRSLPLFPNKDNLYAWLKLEEAGELTAREMPDRAERMHCSHGSSSLSQAYRLSLFGKSGRLLQAAGADRPLRWLSLIHI